MFTLLLACLEANTGFHILPLYIGSLVADAIIVISIYGYLTDKKDN